MVVQPSLHGDFHSLVVTRRRIGKERVREFASEDQLETVKPRLRSDLAQFRADVEGDYDQIEQRSLVDAGVVAAAGFERVRKAELEPA